MESDGSKQLHTEGTGEGISDPLQERPCVDNSPMHGINEQESSQGYVAGGAVPGSGTKGCTGDSSWPILWPKLLQQHIHGPETQREVASDHRSKEAKQVYRLSPFQDGRRTESVGLTPTGQLCFLDRLEGRLSPCSNPQKFSQVPTSVQKRHSVPVQGLALRSLYRSSNFHQNSRRGQGNGPVSRDQHVLVSGRLATSGQDLSVRSKSGQVHDRTLQELGMDCEHGEIGVSSHAGVQVHRSLVESPSRSSLPDTGECLEGPADCDNVLELSVSDSGNVAVSDWISNSPTEIHLPSQTEREIYSVESDDQMDSRSGLAASGGDNIPSCPEITVVVERTVDGAKGCTSTGSQVQSPYLHRCVYGGLGGSCPRHDLPGRLVRGRETSPHKCPRDEGNYVHFGEIERTTGNNDFVGNRQHNGGCTHKQTRRDSFVAANERDIRTVQSATAKGVLSESPSHTRKVQCRSRPAIEKRSGSVDRMVPTSAGRKRHIQTVVQTTNRPVCDTVQSQVSDVCLSRSRHSGHSSRRSKSKSGRSRSVRVPASSDSHEIASEISGHKSLQSHCHRSKLAQTEMVSSTTRSSHKRTSTATLLEHASKTTSAKQVSRSGRNIRPSRILFGKEYLMRKGFGDSLSEKMMAPQCQSTLDLYDFLWRQFYDYAVSEGFDAFHPTIPQIARFLHKKYEDGHGVKSIGSFRAAIDATLKHHTNLKVNKDLQLSELIKGYKIERPRLRKTEPEWDIAFILFSLAHKPFEPLEDGQKVSLELLSWKTLFLLLLASGARRCEMHAVIEKGTKIAVNGKYATVSPSSKFVAKNEVARGKPLDPFIIRALKGHSDSDMNICPVRCLNFYKKRTEILRGSRKKLFITTMRSTREIHKNTLSSWIKKLLKFCYRNPGKKAVQLTGTGVHEIRRIASTLVFRGTTSMEEVLKVGSWKSPTTFTDFYLKDLALLDGKSLRSLGPISVGQKVVLNTRIA